MLTLTDNAQVAIRTLTEAVDEPGDAGIRIATAPGTDGSSPELALAVVPEPAPGDQVVDEGGARVYLDATAARMLEEETLDVQIDPAAQGVNFVVT